MRATKFGRRESAIKVSLTLREGVVLVHALVDRVASAHGIRVLCIKGPGLNVQRLRVQRDSQDVDVLVDPAHFDEMCEELFAVGWHPNVAQQTEIRSAPEHSETLIHDAWPCSLDLHRYFPGCLAPAQQVFDALWARRSSVNLGGRDLPCPDVLGSSVIVGLNALRNPDSWREQTELAHLTQVLGKRLDDAERADLARLAGRMGAEDTLRPLLDTLGVQHGPAAPRFVDGLASWRLQTVLGSYPTLMRLDDLRQTPWHRRPAVLWHGALLTEDEIRHARPDLPAGRWGLILGRLDRLRRVLPKIPRAARYLAKSRGSR